MSTTIRMNYIGTNVSGTLAIPNSFAGVAIFDAVGTLVGSSSDSEGR